MSIEAWYTVGTLVLVIAILATNRIGVDVAMVGGLTLLMIGDVILDGDIITVPQAIEGFANRVVVLIAALLVVAAGLRETGGMQLIAQRLLGRPKSVIAAQIRLMVPVAAMSAFMNNTPIVAMYLPIVNDWSRKLNISPSKLFIPLSYASILGGKITYIGTASNIVLIGLFTQDIAARSEVLEPLGVTPMTSTQAFWSVAWLGIPTTIAGLAFIAVTAKWLLPERRPAHDLVHDARQYHVEMEVQPDAPIVGKTIEEAGLRHLPGLYLTQIDRAGKTIVAVSPNEKLEANDVLSFAGVLESVVDLRKIRGLVPATDQIEKVKAQRGSRILVEAVVAQRSPLVGKTVRQTRFRTMYNAAIVAVYRQGRQINRKIGDIALEAGDTLLLDTHDGFVPAHRNSGDFYLVSSVEGSRPIRHERAWLALSILALLIVLFTRTALDQVIVAFLCAILMIGTRCVTGTIARNAINLQILIVIGAALGMGTALQETGAADAIAHGLLSAADTMNLPPRAMLAIIFVLAAGFAQVINIAGAAVLMYPITMATAIELKVNPEPFVYTLMVAAGSSFILPIAYQTNLMVLGPGGYKFSDFMRIGVPLTILVGVVCVVIAPIVFPFA
ncbi:MAG: SLC13 family permease [Planctomycetota bacterium]